MSESTQNKSQLSEPKSIWSTRRNFLKGGAAAIAASAVVTNAAPASGQSSWGYFNKPAPIEPTPQPLPFCHGVASGDPLPDSVILWTRVTPDETARPGSGTGEDTDVRWEVSPSESFDSVVASGTARTSRSSDHTVHVDVKGLTPESVYYYRFIVEGGPHSGAHSPVGRTKTAPANNAHVESFKIASFSCANWEAGFYTPYRDLAERGRRGELDLAVCLGDYIYEYGQRSNNKAAISAVRLFQPPHEILNLEDYRIRYGQAHTDLDLQAAHAALPWVSVWDDHEVANDNYDTGAENHTALTEGSYRARRSAASQAYIEWMPIRSRALGEGGKLYRTFTFGDLIELTMMDLRTYRDKVGRITGPLTPSAPRSMLGDEQYQWLVNTLRSSKAKWNVLGNSVMFSPLAVGALRNDPNVKPVLNAMVENLGDNVQLFADVAEYGVLVNSDQWDGYLMERKQLTIDMAEAGVTPLFLTGDIHSEWAHTVYDGDKPLGCEMVCASISATGVGDILGHAVGPHPTMNGIAYNYLHNSNPQLRHVDWDAHGYCVATIRPDDVDMTWMRADNIADPLSAVRPTVVLNWRKGVGFTN